MTRVDQIKEARQLRYVQGLPIREISRRLNLSRNTIRKILRSQQTEFTYRRSKKYRPVGDKIHGMIEIWLKEDQTMRKKYKRTSHRMYDILRERYGYTGSYMSVLRCVRKVRDELNLRDREVFIPLTFDAGEAFQFDWGEVQVSLNNQLVNLNLAVIVLCHSRHFYARVYPLQKQELMLDAHRKAFEHFGGGCKRGIYDNLKSAVKHLLKGHHRNLQERFVQFCSHYLYEPEFCNPARGNEKGRVENMIGYVRRNFFTPIVNFASIEELNERLMSFAISSSRTKNHPETPAETRYAVYLKEKELLIQLPFYGFDCCRTSLAVVSSCSTIFFENNRYSVPTDYMGRAVLVKGYAEEVVVSYDGQEIARHKRIYGTKQQVFNPYHYLEVLVRKPRAFKDGMPFKSWQLPEVFLEYRRLLQERYSDGDKYFANTLLLLKSWPLKDVTSAVDKAVNSGILGDSYILAFLRHAYETTFEESGVSIRTELLKYHAQQRPLSYYDEVLRRSNISAEEEIKK